MLEEVEFLEENDTELDTSDTLSFSDAVLHSTDWTVETLVSQLTRGNIEMSPRFQRRDAWSIGRKSGFIESLILGLPVPQIVLAEKKGQRGKYIVLDGKQRLLSLLQFTGNAKGENNAFKLSGLDARTDLKKKTYIALNDPSFENDLNAFLNYTIRTVVIRNWPSYDFLHLVFLRLNTGSVKLSPQELRQAMFPGKFSDAVDDSALDSESLKLLLGRNTPDPRMRDVEILVRFLSFQFFLDSYPGRMKDFLDLTCEKLNDSWGLREFDIRSTISEFELAAKALIEIFGENKVARKLESKSFNRAIFDTLIFYAANFVIRTAMLDNKDAVVAAFRSVALDTEFLAAVESDTAGIPNTSKRLIIWGSALRDSIGLNFEIPILKVPDLNLPGARAGIGFSGFGV